VTLLVGILCKDGIVIAADRQVTHGDMGLPQTVGQPGTKISEIPGNILLASSGFVGLAQRLKGIVESDSGYIGSHTYEESAKRIHQQFAPILQPVFEMAKRASPVMGSNANLEAVCGHLLAAKFADGLKLVEITPTLNFEYRTVDVPFVCCGTGKQNADPFLRFLWSVYWPDRPPTVEEGILAAYWTVTAVAVDLKSPGVGMGEDVFVLQEEKHGGKTKHVARRVEKEKLLPHDELIAEAKKRMRSVTDDMLGRGQAVEAAAPPPKFEEGKPEAAGKAA
jgi:proteasome beta subunit